MNPSLYKIEVYFPDGVCKNTYRNLYSYMRLFIAIGLHSFMKEDIRYG